MVVASHALSPEAETILIVEDEVPVRFEVADYLRECGYHVIEATNASDGLNVLQTDRRIDLAFVGVQLSGSMDGFGLARWLRKLRLILTSYAQATWRVQGPAARGGLELRKRAFLLRDNKTADKTAKALGLTVPLSLLGRADEVIEGGEGSLSRFSAAPLPLTRKFAHYIIPSAEYCRRVEHIRAEARARSYSATGGPLIYPAEKPSDCVRRG